MYCKHVIRATISESNLARCATSLATSYLGSAKGSSTVLSANPPSELRATRSSMKWPYHYHLGSEYESHDSPSAGTALALLSTRSRTCWSFSSLAPLAPTYRRLRSDTSDVPTVFSQMVEFRTKSINKKNDGGAFHSELCSEHYTWQMALCAVLMICRQGCDMTIANQITSPETNSPVES